MADEHRNKPRKDSIDPSSVGPNYLRASTGSCHDFCKSGKAHASETKAKDFLRRKPVKKPTEDEILVKRAVFPEKKNPPVERPRSSPGSQSPVPEAHDARQKDKNSDMQNLVRGNLVAKKMDPAMKIRLSPKPSVISPTGKKLIKTDFFSTNGTSNQALPTSETSKQIRRAGDTSKLVQKVGETSKPVGKISKASIQVQKRNETLVTALPKPKERSLSGSIMVHVDSNSPSLIRLEKRGGMKPQKKNSGTHVMTKNIYMSSSDSPSLKPLINKILTSNTFSKTIVVKETTFDRASTMKSKDKAKDAKVARESNREKRFVNEEERPDVEDTESDTSKMVDNVSIEEIVIFDFKEMESKPVKNSDNEPIAESILVEGATMEDIGEGTSLSECIMEGTNMNVEVESEPLEDTVSQCNVERNIIQVREIESKELGTTAREGIAEINIMEVEETQSLPLELVIDESTIEGISGPLPASIAESSSLSPCSSPPHLQEEDQTESEYIVSECEEYSASENEESNIKGIEASEEGNGKLHRKRGGSYHPINEDVKHWKLQFRWGRIIDVQYEDNILRRLRFQRGRVLVENQNQNAEFGVNDLKRGQTQGERNNHETDVKVLLRHSDIQEKKDAKGLFNNVIEETASKLVETRRSKVKALVGAFETIISLQDMKPSADT
ncbi:hypothetical protein SAY87_004796 [Trapa incisa]|uniref:Calmodulin-binding domain-containing protein n=1 Tax=Trapa incisa TaxID=236973 RepID=A0AAN7JPQ1_9MYRT|nr:hypothetical protein SAY87_004796 [Trapa incisa]